MKLNSKFWEDSSVQLLTNEQASQVVGGTWKVTKFTKANPAGTKGIKFQISGDDLPPDPCPEFMNHNIVDIKKQVV